MKTIRRVFLAGKITGNEWRRSLVQGDLALHPEEPGGCLFSEMALGGGLAFPVRSKALLSMLDYVGPYYVAAPDCDCSSSSHNHGCWENSGRYYLLQANMHALAACDLVFAWLDDASAAVTLYELGYAVALGKPLLMAGPRELPELGLIYHASEYCTFAWYGSPPASDATPRAAFVHHLAHFLYDHAGQVTIDGDALSPIESRFLGAWNDACAREKVREALFPQYPLDDGRYRLDFAYLDPCLFEASRCYGTVKIAIELDGLEAHSTTDQIAADRRRQREIEAMGWRVIRFGGKEVYHNVEACVAEARSIIAASLDRAREQAPGLGGMPILDDTLGGEVDLMAEPELIDA